MRLGLLGKLRGNQVVISAINVNWKGGVHRLDGVTSKKQTVEIEIPFANKKGEGVLMFKTQEKKPEIITAISVQQPFRLLDVSPKPPVEVKEGERVSFKLRIGLPDYGYNGPLNLTLGAAAQEMVMLELPKVVLKRGERSVEVENPRSIISVLKNGVFQHSVQLYKALSYNDRVGSIKVGAPFSLVSSEPKTPFSIDDPNSYIVSLWIQAPDHNYAGPLVIELG